MKTALLIFLLSCPVWAQLPEAPHRFMDRTNLTLISIDAGAHVADGLITARTVNNYAGIETNPLARPFVSQGVRGQVAYFAADFALNVGVAYLFHKTGHHKMERWALVIGSGLSAQAAIRSEIAFKKWY